MTVEERFEYGKKIRAEQDKVIALFISQVRNVEDMDYLTAVKKELLGGKK
ncbi:hypothetical protein [Metabacillus sp. FJAT-52054]|uniref:Uncharacterized protein n=1 Tax=Metabacillus sediminis TaxID=3117746 RepID=A0ABZ2NHK5_9BACI